MVAKKQTEEEVIVPKVETETFSCYLLGTSPLIMNRVSEKAARELLLPRRKTAADKAGSLKHNPPDEYRASAYQSVGDAFPTRLLMPTLAFKSALCSVAVDIPGAAKAQIGRLTYVNGDYVSVYGVPKLRMDIVRSADMNRTPDVRTRATLAQWACRVSVTFVRPILRQQSVVNLLAAAGVMRGVGDYRQEKGRGNYGLFKLVGADDPDYIDIVSGGGREAQDAALLTPEPYDAQTEELLSWFTDESGRRGFKVA